MDGVLKYHIKIHDDETATRIITQPTEDIILERNKELRKNEDALRDLGQGSEGGTWGRQVATIPENLLIWATRNGYDIYNKDQQISSKELFRFLNSEKGKACLIRERI